MNVSQIVNNSVNSQSNNLPKTASQKTQEKNSTLSTENVDKFDSSSVNVNRNYQSATHRTDSLNVQGYKGQSALQIKNSLMADYVSFLFKGQSGNNILDTMFNPKPFALDAFNAAEASSAKHADYWGVEAVAERLVTFAKTLAGNDEKMFATMKNAFLKGFSLAAGAVGGKLPDISHQTKARALELFDEWEAEINARKNPAAAES